MYGIKLVEAKIDALNGHGYVVGAHVKFETVHSGTGSHHIGKYRIHEDGRKKTDTRVKETRERHR